MSKMPAPESRRGELYLEKTELQDEIRSLRPTLRRRRNWGLGIGALGAVNILSGVLGGGPPAVFGGFLILVLSIPPWFFYGMAAHEIRWLKTRIGTIEAEMEWKGQEEEGP